MGATTNHVCWYISNWPKLNKKRKQNKNKGEEMTGDNAKEELF